MRPAGGAPLRVVLVEDHGVVREGLRLLLDATPGLAVAGVAADGEAALGLLAALGGVAGVDVLVTDLGLPGMDGVALTRRVKAVYPGVRVLALSGSLDPALLDAALAAGADGFAGKLGAFAALLAAVRAVGAGEAYLPPELAGRLLAHLRTAAPRARASDRLSPREREVLAGMAAGRTSKAIGRELGLTLKTVENVRARILAKLGAPNAASAIAVARQRGLLDAPPDAKALAAPERQA